jgi:hypothetical protein
MLGKNKKRSNNEAGHDAIPLQRREVHPRQITKQLTFMGEINPEKGDTDLVDLTFSIDDPLWVKMVFNPGYEDSEASTWYVSYASIAEGRYEMFPAEDAISETTSFIVNPALHEGKAVVAVTLLDSETNKLYIAKLPARGIDEFINAAEKNIAYHDGHKDLEKRYVNNAFSELARVSIENYPTVGQ